MGKSALVIRLVTDNFLDEYDPTIEDSYRKQVVIDSDPAILDILDTAGQEEYSSMQDQWMREGKGFMLVYSVADRASFDEITVFKDKILRAKELDKVPIVLVGNKCDLDASERQISTEEGQELAKQMECPFLETSAKAKINNKSCFTLQKYPIRNPIVIPKNSFITFLLFCHFLDLKIPIFAARFIKRRKQRNEKRYSPR